MKKLILAYFLLCCFVNLQSQEAADDPVKKEIKTSHQIKLGASLQYEWSGWYYYEDDYYYYDYDYDYRYNYSSNLSYYDGPNTQLFLAYEHIWTFPAKMAVSIEPKLGLAFREYLTSAFVGANWKFYWVDRGSWRMGVYFYTGYEYLNGDRSIYVGMHDGMYRQLIDITMHQNIFSFDLGLVPFQFTPENTPLTVELNFNLFGLRVFKNRSSEYKLGNGQTERYNYTDLGGYGPRVELKVGWNIQ